MDNYQDSKCLALEKALDDETVDPIDLPFLFLKAITKDFSKNQIIGIGGFGTVYKGALRNGKVAVKKVNPYNKIEITEEDFQREVACLVEVKHKNIVRFLGYCSETQHVITPYEGKNVWVDAWQMLFCFEYLSKGSLDKYLTEAPSGLQWRVSYQIIKGICKGVDYLHQHRIIHMDLKPQNILLDDSMVPKIADFGISRRFNGNQSRTITKNIVGTVGYMAPEFVRSGIITFKTDIYNLGVIIIEILTGSKECPNVDKVLESWAKTFELSEGNSILEQIKVCAEIGISCMDDDPRNRPAIHDIILRLDEMDILNSCSFDKSGASTSSAGQLADEVKSIQLADEVKSVTVSSTLSQREQSSLGRFDQNYRLAKKASKPMRISASKESGETTTQFSESELLDVHPLELCFPFEVKKHIQCSLNIINRTDHYVSYRIIPQFPDMYTSINVVLCRILDPMSTVALSVTMVDQEQLPPDAGMFEILMISMGSKRDLKGLISSIGKVPKIDADLLNRVEELGGEVYAATLMAVARPPSVRDNCQPSSHPKIVSTVNLVGTRTTIDVHPTEPWVLVGHGKYVSIWDYEKQVRMVELDIEDEADRRHWIIERETQVFSAIFIPRMQWFVAGDDQRYIQVYMCHPLKQIKRFQPNNGWGTISSLAIHPTCPYLLSACNYGVIKLWDWDMDWACSIKVNFSNDFSRGWDWVLVKFSPNDAHIFTGATGGTTSFGEHDEVKVWSIHSSAQPIRAIDMDRNSLLDYDFTEAGRDHVVTMTYDSLNIWDLQTGTCVHTIYATGYFITAIACCPILPLIAAGIKANITDGTPAVCFWNSTHYRLEKTVHCTFGSQIRYLGFVGTRRLVIGTDEGIEILEIDMESLVSQQ